MFIKAAMAIGQTIVDLERKSRCDETEAVTEFGRKAQAQGLLAGPLAMFLPIFACRWAKCGFPVVRFGERLAASLMATRVAYDAVPDVALPWDCFAVVPPPDVLSVQWAIVMKSQQTSEDPPRNRIRTLVFSARHIEVWEESGIEGFADESAGSLGTVDGMRTDMPPEENLAEARLFGRLLLGACIELDQPKHRIVISNGPLPARARLARSPEPKAWTFQLTRDVRVDCREWVTSYLSGKEGKSASIQSLVRGHHKRQPCGPEGKDRKWIHVEPYWRGPEDAPIAVRSHVLQ